MEYNSFYGGRQGASFVIVKKYKVIKVPNEDNETFNRIIRIDMGIPDNEEISQETRKKWLLDNCMIYAFSQGGNYKTVNYDEYVLIDTVNKNDKDNGKIYRRGYKYNDDMGGAIYIGQIVGPAGMAPHVEFKTVAEVEELADVDGLVDEEGNQYRKTEGSYAPTENLIPGKYIDVQGHEQFNDEIQYVACSVRDIDSHETTVHIGFKIPYLVTEYTAKTVDPYYHRTDATETEDFENDELIVRMDAQNHPYFQHWHISVPKGIKGDAFKRLRVTTVEECIQNGTTIIGQDNQPIVLQDYEGYQDDNLNGKSDFEHSYKKRKILVYDYYHYDRVAGGDPVALYLGDYNMIDDFRIDEDGTIRIVYSHDDTEIYANYLKAVRQIQLNVDTGLLQIDYNFDQQYERDENGDFKLDNSGNKIPVPGTETHYETYLHWVKDIHFDDEGTVTWEFTRPEDDRTDNQKVKWLKNLTLNPVNGQFDIDFNYDQEYEVNQGEDITKKGIYKLDANGERIPIPNTETHIHENLQWVKDIRYDQDGTLTWSYTWKDNVLEKQETLPNFLKWIEGVKLNAATGKFEIDFNYETEPTGAVDHEGNDISGQPTHYETSLTWVKDITFGTDGTITVIYTDQDNLSYPTYMKWIDQVKLNSETGKFEIDFNYDQEYETDSRGQFILNGSGEKIPIPGTKTHYEVNLKWVKGVTIDNEGTIRFKHTQGNDTVYNKYLRTIKNITLNPENGAFDIDYNHATDAAGNNTHYHADLRFVKDVQIEDNGTIKFIYTYGDSTQGTVATYNNFMKKIDAVTLNGQTGHFTVTYNYPNEADGTPTQYDTDLRWVNDINLAANGTVTVGYTTGADVVLDNKIKWITKSELAENGTLTFTYNDGTVQSFSEKIKWIDNIYINELGVFKITFNDGTSTTTQLKILNNASVDTGATEGEGSQKIRAYYSNGTSETIGEPINYIMKTAINDAYHLLILYSDPVRRAEIKTNGLNATWEGRDDWYDLGYIGQGGTVGALVGAEDDAGVQAIAETLPPYSAWFIVEEE